MTDYDQGYAAGINRAIDLLVGVSMNQIANSDGDAALDQLKGLLTAALNPPPPPNFEMR